MSGDRKDDDDYKYMQVVDALRSINQQVNLIGIVTHFTLPKPTKGTDLYCSVTIIGESRPDHGISVRFFGETNDKLPCVELVGDIILITRVTMKTDGSGVCAKFNKKRSSFALYEGRDCSGEEFVPYKKSPNFPYREQDKKLITGLRKWLTHDKIQGLNDLLLLRQIKEGKCFDLLCKILHACEVKKDESMLFLWDGTDTPPVSIEANLEDEVENPLPLYLEPSLLSRDILCTFPPVGTVLRMIANQGIKKIGVNFLHANRWVKFVNIKCEVLAGLWRAVLLPSSKLCFLSDDDARVAKLQRRYNRRVSSEWEQMPFTCFPSPSDITETDHPNVPFVTLMNVLTHREVTCKFKCVARVVAIFPWRAEEFLSPYGIYRVRLTLEDPTARIHAFLYAEDGMKFFGNHSANILTRKRNVLLGIAEGDGEHSSKTLSRNPPWIECCLKSYYIDKSDTWGSRNYRIFGTALSLPRVMDLCRV